jgi:hypothetical protein
MSIQTRTFLPLSVRPRPSATRSVVAQPWRCAGEEPHLEELYADPLLHLVMARDGVSEAVLREVVASAQAKLAARPLPGAWHAAIEHWRGVCCSAAA